MYQDELKGDWFRVAEALNLPIYPHPDYRVIRLEFRDHKGPDEGHT